MPTLTLCKSFGFCALLSCGGAFGAPLLTQAGELHPGDVARVSATAPPLRHFVGRIVSLTADTLALETDEPVARIAISRAALTSTERRLPDASRAEHAMIGGALGLVGGGALGGLAGAAGGKRCSTEAPGFPCRDLGAVIGAIGGGVLGMLVGTAIGLALPVERWSPVKRLSLSMTPIHTGTRSELQVAVRF